MRKSNSTPNSNPNSNNCEYRKAKQFQEMQSLYFKEIESEIRFVGELSDKASVQATVDLALECTTYIEDDEDEQVINEAITCWNCRYRIWRTKGFTCYNKFYLN